MLCKKWGPISELVFSFTNGPHNVLWLIVTKEQRNRAIKRSYHLSEVSKNILLESSTKAGNRVVWPIFDVPPGLCQGGSVDHLKCSVGLRCPNHHVAI